MIGFYNLCDIGNFLDSSLKREGDFKGELTIYVNNKDELLKIDEDLFYRQHPNSDEFVKSDDEIMLNFANSKITIKVRDDGSSEKKEVSTNNNL
jgi:hypothetical protein